MSSNYFYLCQVSVIGLCNVVKNIGWQPSRHFLTSLPPICPSISFHSVSRASPFLTHTPPHFFMSSSFYCGYFDNTSAIWSAKFVEEFFLDNPCLPSTTFPWLPSHQRTISPVGANNTRCGTNCTWQARTPSSPVHKCVMFLLGHDSSTSLLAFRDPESQLMVMNATLPLNRCRSRTFDEARWCSWSMFDRQPSRPNGLHASMLTKDDCPVLVIQKSKTHTLPRQYSLIFEDTPVLKFLTRMLTNPSLMPLPACRPPQPPACNWRMGCCRVCVAGGLRVQVVNVFVAVALSVFGPRMEREEDRASFWKHRMDLDDASKKDEAGGAWVVLEGNISVRWRSVATEETASAPALTLLYFLVWVLDFFRLLLPTLPVIEPVLLLDVGRRLNNVAPWPFMEEPLHDI